MWNDKGVQRQTFICGVVVGTGFPCRRLVTAPGRRCFQHALPVQYHPNGRYVPNKYTLHNGVDTELFCCQHPDILPVAVRQARLLAISSVAQTVQVISQPEGEIVLTVYGYTRDIEPGPNYEQHIASLMAQEGFL